MLNKELNGIAEKMLMEMFMKEHPEVLDDDIEDAFERWLDDRYEDIKNELMGKLKA